MKKYIDNRYIINNLVLISLFFFVVFLLVVSCKKKSKSQIDNKFDITFSSVGDIPSFKENGGYDNFKDGVFKGYGQLPPGAVWPTKPNELLIVKSSSSEGSNQNTTSSNSYAGSAQIDLSAANLSLGYAGAQDFRDVINPDDGGNPYDPDYKTPQKGIEAIAGPIVEDSSGVSSTCESLYSSMRSNDVDERIEKFAFLENSLTKSGMSIFLTARAWIDEQDAKVAHPLACVTNVSQVMANAKDDDQNPLFDPTYFGTGSSLISNSYNLIEKVLDSGGKAIVFPSNYQNQDLYSGLNLNNEYENSFIIASDFMEKNSYPLNDYKNKTIEMWQNIFYHNKFIEEENHRNNKKLPVGSIILGCEKDCSSHGVESGVHAGIVGDLDSKGNIMIYHNNWFRPDGINDRSFYMVPFDSFYEKLLPRKWMPTPALKTQLQDNNNGNKRGMIIGSAMTAIDSFDITNENFMTVVLITQNVYNEWHRGDFVNHHKFLAKQDNFHQAKRTKLLEERGENNQKLICTGKVGQLKDAFFKSPTLNVYKNDFYNQCNNEDDNECEGDYNLEFHILKSQDNNWHKIGFYFRSKFYGFEDKGDHITQPDTNDPIWIQAEKNKKNEDRTYNLSVLLEREGEIAIDTIYEAFSCNYLYNILNKTDSDLFDDSVCSPTSP